MSGDGSDYAYGISVATGEAGSFELLGCRPYPCAISVTGGVTYHLQVFDGQDDGGKLELTVDLADSAG